MDPFIGQVIQFAGNFAPRDWAFCDGQLMAISSNQALFSILGTTYGGDGRTTFGLPDMRGRVPMHPGSGPGLTPRRLGERTGAETTALTSTNLPQHTHTATLQAENAGADTNDPTGNMLAKSGADSIYKEQVPRGDIAMSPQSIIGGPNNDGHSTPFNNIQPSMNINFIIALQGTYPSRS